MQQPPAQRDSTPALHGQVASEPGVRCAPHPPAPPASPPPPRRAQPALFVAGLAAVERLRAADPGAVAAASACAGLSLGEYTALVFAGALSFEDGLKVGGWWA